MSSPVIPLAAGFAPATHDQWLALVAKTLKGKGPEALVRRTADGQEILPLYVARDALAPLPFAPSARGSHGWDIRAVVANPDSSLANAEALAALAGGAVSVIVMIDTGDGRGVTVASAGDLARVLDGVMTDVAPVALDAGFLGRAAADWLDDVTKASPTAPLALNLDPLSAFAAAGASPGPVEAHLEAAAATAARLAETYPRAGLFLASGAVVHEAGGSPAWELAFAMASAVAYAKAMTAAGMSMDQAFAGLTLGLAVDAEPLGAIAKLRAGRVLWGRIAQACGAPGAARIEARSSGRMLTRADRWTNLVRLTSAGFGAALGGADAIVLGAFTDAIGAPDAFALRMARNTQLVLLEEAHLGRVADPAGGSWALEAQTSDLARAAWTHFQEIEAARGAVAALRSGLIADAVGSAREGLAATIAEKSLRIIGVTDFPSAEAAPEPAPPTKPPHDPLAVARLPGADDACAPLAAIRLEDMAQ